MTLETEPSISDRLGGLKTSWLEDMGIDPELFTEEAFSAVLAVLGYVTLEGRIGRIKPHTMIERLLVVGSALRYEYKKYVPEDPDDVESV